MVFAFDGILGKLPNNNRSIKTQMMKRFINDTAVLVQKSSRMISYPFTSLMG